MSRVAPKNESLNFERTGRQVNVLGTLSRFPPYKLFAWSNGASFHIRGPVLNWDGGRKVLH